MWFFQHQQTHTHTHRGTLSQAGNNCTYSFQVHIKTLKVNERTKLKSRRQSHKKPRRALKKRRERDNTSWGNFRTDKQCEQCSVLQRRRNFYWSTWRCFFFFAFRFFRLSLFLLAFRLAFFVATAASSAFVFRLCRLLYALSLVIVATVASRVAWCSTEEDFRLARCLTTARSPWGKSACIKLKKGRQSQPAWHYAMSG